MQYSQRLRQGGGNFSREKYTREPQKLILHLNSAFLMDFVIDYINCSKLIDYSKLIFGD